MEVLRLGLGPSDTGATGASEVATVSEAFGDVIDSSVFASFLFYCQKLQAFVRAGAHTSSLESCLLKKPITPPLCEGVDGLLLGGELVVV